MNLSEVINKIAMHKDELLFKQFERHGYSREEILSIAREGRVCTLEYGFKTDYGVDGIYLFSMQEVTIEDFANGKVSVEYTFDDIVNIV